MISVVVFNRRLYMLDRDTFILIRKIVLAVITLLLIFFVVVPKWQEFNAAFTEKLQAFMRSFLEGAFSIANKAPEKKNEFIATDISESKSLFAAKFLNGMSGEDIKSALKAGEFLITITPDDTELLHRVAFLNYVLGDYEKARKYYDLILNRFPPKKMTIEYLKGRDECHGIQRALLELAALSFEEKYSDEMINYYTRFLRAFYRKDVYKEFVEKGVNELSASLDIFTKLSEEGVFCIMKSIESLEKIRHDYPENNDVIYLLGMSNFALVNQLSCNPEKISLIYIDNAERYLNKAVEKSPVLQREKIRKTLEVLQKIKTQIIVQKETEKKTQE